MEQNTADIVIVGAGLTGLTLAYLLQKRNIDFLILEARDRIGGRIHTVGGEGTCPIEMGATWVGQDQQYLLNLLAELKLGVFEQLIGQHAIYEQSSMSPAQLVTLPSNPSPSLRIKGGTQAIIKALSNTIPSDSIHINQTVTHINHGDRGVQITTDKGVVKAKTIVSTLPPHLLQTIIFDPALPNELQEALQNCHTWMGESIKIGFRFNKPFWREKGTSGTIFSNVGPISEFYDHSSSNDSTYGLKGFLNGAYYKITKEERKELALNQLRKYYGDAIDSYTSYEETVWRNEPFTFNSYKTHLLPHQNNGHKAFQYGYSDNRLIIAGAETSSISPGYMEGAVRSAYKVLQQVT